MGDTDALEVDLDIPGERFNATLSYIHNVVYFLIQRCFEPSGQWWTQWGTIKGQGPRAKRKQLG